MGRRKQTKIQTLRTRIFHEMLVRNCDHSEAQMDLLFCHPNKVQMAYKERRRIFSGMKKGKMPYVGTERNDFLNIVSQHNERFMEICNIYRSNFWDEAKNVKNPYENRQVLVGVIKRLSKLSPKPLKAGLFEELKSNEFTFGEGNDYESKYITWVRQYISPFGRNLDLLIFIGCLYREAFYFSQPKLAWLLKIELMNITGRILVRLGVRPPLLKEFSEYINLHMLGSTEHLEGSAMPLSTKLALDMKNVNPVLKGLIKIHDQIESEILILINGNKY